MNALAKIMNIITVSIICPLFQVVRGWYFQLVAWFGFWVVAATSAIIISLLVVIIIPLFPSPITPAQNEESDQRRLVSLTSVNDIGTVSSEVSTIGTVTARSEASLVSERGGRITSLNVTLGQAVSAGSVVATFENASERASVAQAQANLDAARASARQASSGVTDAEEALLQAKKSAVVAHNDAFTIANQLLVNAVDIYFGNPSATIPGLRINGFGFTNQLNNARYALNATMNNWRITTTQLQSQDPNLSDVLATTIIYQNELLSLLDVLIEIVPNQPPIDRTRDEWRREADTLVREKSRIITSRNNIESAQSAILRAREALLRAQISGSADDTAISLAQAQIRQAEASVMQANAQLARTIVRAPISGTINTLSVKLGDTTSPQFVIGSILNQQGQEIVAYISDVDMKFITVGQEVIVGNQIAKGVITQIAPSISSVTGRVEIRIAVDANSLTIGETVRIRIRKDVDSIASNSLLRIPLNAVRFIGDDAFVFVVVNERLELLPITVASVRGTSIEVTSGIENDTLFVSDARGRQIGELVRVN
jgi:multidrug resistance efflux pump